MIKRNFALLSFLILALYFLCLASYAKSFAYWKLSAGGIPLFVSDLTLALVVALRWHNWRNLRRAPRIVLLLLAAYLGWGALRLGLSWFFEKPELGLVECLQQSALWYQAVWLLVPLLFEPDELRRLFSVTLAGAVVAQAIGWIGVLLMGRYNAQVSRLVGFPVGNEVILPLYPLAFLFWRPGWAFLGSLAFGQLWLVQFVIYMKRAWLFALFLFNLPVLAYYAGPARIRQLGLLSLAVVLGICLAAGGLELLKRRTEPVFYHASERALAEKQRESFPWLARIPLTALDNIFPYTDLMETGVSWTRIIFKGDRSEGSNSVADSMMAFRMHLWRQAWHGFLDRPWVGQGFGRPIARTQLNGLPAMVNGRWISGPHNSFLAVLHRLGVLGFLIFAGLLGDICFCFFRGWRHFSSFEGAITAAISSTLFFAFFNVCLENPQGGIWFWVFLGMALRVASTRNTLPP